MPAGTSLKRMSPRAGVLYASAARTATPTAATISNREGFTGLQVTIDVTAASATPSVVPTIDVYDPASGKWSNLLTGAAITGVSTVRLRVGRGLTETANVDASDVLGRTLRLVMTHADTDSITYSAGFELVP